MANNAWNICMCMLCSSLDVLWLCISSASLYNFDGWQEDAKVDWYMYFQKLKKNQFQYSTVEPFEFGNLNVPGLLQYFHCVFLGNCPQKSKVVIQVGCTVGECESQIRQPGHHRMCICITPALPMMMTMMCTHLHLSSQAKWIQVKIRS